MKEDTRRLLLVTAFGVTLFVGLSHLDAIRGFLVWVWNILEPLTVGGLLAFLLNVPVTGIERGLERLTAGFSRRPGPRFLRGVGILATLAGVVLVLFLVGTLVVPAISDSVGAIAELIRQQGPSWVEALKQYGIDTSVLQEKLISLDKSQLISDLVNHTGNMLNNLMDAASTAVGLAGNFIIALVLSFYLLADKQMLSRQTKKLLRAYLPDAVSDRAVCIGALISRTYARFLSGQCVEAVILGCLMFAAFSVFRLPYAGLVAVLTAVCAFIPYIGAFLSCAVAVLLNLMISPLQALISLAVFQAIQFVEGQFIYPRVVGGSIGLPSLWTLVAAVLGGKIFGVIGMIFFIPAFAVLYTLLRESAEFRLTKRGTGASAAPEASERKETPPGKN